MPKGYRAYFSDQDFLLPPSLGQWLPEGHLAYLVSDVVDQLDLTPMHTEYGEERGGQPPYDPRRMTKLLVYGYCVGVYSSRKIQQRLVEDVAFRVLAAGNEPDFRTLSDFRKIHLKTLSGFFEEVLKIVLETGAMKLGRVRWRGPR
jgi:transposase